MQYECQNDYIERARFWSLLVFHIFSHTPDWPKWTKCFDGWLCFQMMMMLLLMMMVESSVQAHRWACSQSLNLSWSMAQCASVGPVPTLGGNVRRIGKRSPVREGIRIVVGVVQWLISGRGGSIVEWAVGDRGDAAVRNWGRRSSNGGGGVEKGSGLRDSHGQDAGEHELQERSHYQIVRQFLHCLLNLPA